MLTRRQFLGLSGGAAVTGAAAWMGLLRDHAPSRGPTPPGADDHVLVVVQLSGGNDALNTVVPLDGRYHDLRPTLGLDDSTLVPLAGESTVGLHPALAPLVPLWEAGQLAIVPDVGFASDSRSHFESLDVWWSASPDHTEQTGWLGRWLDATDLASDNPLVAIALGGGAVPALRSTRSQATAVNDLAGFDLKVPPGSDRDQLTDAVAATASPAVSESLLAQAQRSVTSALRAVDVLASTQSNVPVEGDDPDAAAAGPVAAGLAAAAKLDDLATGVSSFFTTLGQRGHAERVLLLTTSEFGRRAAENGSGGTDHGHGGVQFLAGPGARGGLHGTVDVALLAGHRDDLGLLTA